MSILFENEYNQYFSINDGELKIGFDSFNEYVQLEKNEEEVNIYLNINTSLDKDNQEQGYIDALLPYIKGERAITSIIFYCEDVPVFSTINYNRVFSINSNYNERDHKFAGNLRLIHKEGE